MYDAIVVGARCAGSPTAMLLARKGYRVLLLDKASFPSDTMSTHFIHIPGVARLERWGLLEQVAATGCPPITNVRVELSSASFSPPAPPGGQTGALPAYCPRRTVLDKILVDAAVAAGAELRDDFPVRELLWDGGRVAGVRGGVRGGPEVAERARIVIGADGMRSLVAREVQAPEYNTRPSMSFGYYAYWNGVPLEGAELHFMEDAGLLVFPTNGGLTCIAVGGPSGHFPEFRKDITKNYLAVVNRATGMAEKMRDAQQAERFVGTNEQPNYFRRPFGPGWALVGDAGYHRDFVTGLGITDAFRDAELLAAAVDDGLAGRRPIDEAMAEYERRRNEFAEPLYELTVQLVSGEPPTPQQFIAFGIAMQRMMPREAIDARP